MKCEKIHTYLCIVLWCLWLFGILITISHAIFSNVNAFNVDWFFWKVVEPYNRILLLFSLIPIEPLICIFIFISKHEPVKKTLLFFLSTVILWVAYIIIYVSFTGGI